LKLVFFDAVSVDTDVVVNRNIVLSDFHGFQRDTAVAVLTESDDFTAHQNTEAGNEYPKTFPQPFTLFLFLNRFRKQLDDGRINLIIDIQNSVKAQQNAGYEHWAKLHNLKEAAKTLNFLTENNLLAYEDLSGKIAEIQALFDDTAATLKIAEKKIADLSLLIKNTENFRRTYGAYKAHRQAKGKEKEQLARQYESALIIHQAARNALRELGIDGKLPDVAALKKERDRLTVDKARLYEQYSGLKKSVAEYGKVKTNIDQILGMNGHEEHRDNARQM
jgi:hypothetical protein